MLQSKGAPIIYGNMGLTNKYTLTGHTSTAVLDDDEIYANSLYYRINSSEPAFIGAEIDHYQCALEKRYFDNYPDTYGSGHAITDPRNRGKTFIDSYLPAASVSFTASSDGNVGGTTIICNTLTQADDYWNTAAIEITSGAADGEIKIVSDFTASSDTLTLSAAFSVQITSGTTFIIHRLLKDDNTTPATWICLWSKPPYHVTREFLTNGIDLVYAVGESVADVHLDAYHKAYAYTEHIPVTIYAANKTGVTGENLKNKAVQELKRIGETYPVTLNLRYLKTSKEVESDAINLYAYEYELIYKRASTSYLSGCTFTYGDNQANTYYIPNVVDVQIRDLGTGDIYLPIPTRVGDLTQILGMSDFEVTLVCDLDMEGVYTWKRPQNTTPKTDTVPWQVFGEAKFGGKTDTDQYYQNLNWGGGSTLPVRVTDINVQNTGEMNQLTVTFRRYTASDLSGSTAKVWYGIS